MASIAVGRHGHHLGLSNAPPPPVVFSNGERDPVCISKPWTNESCYQRVFNGSEVYSAFAMPRGIRHYRYNRPTNHELGRSHARLPVSHTHTQQHPWQPGMWFYYMRGCSDFEWDMGRTILVRNRCHLAGVLEQRAHGVGWARAMIRVAQKLVLASNVTAWAPDFIYHRRGHTIGANSVFVGPLETLINGSADWPPPPGHTPTRGVRELAFALDECARGDLPDNLVERELVMNLWSLNTLDYTNAAVLSYDLRGTEKELDTIQIANQCSATTIVNQSRHHVEMCTQPVELWDVRALSADWGAGNRNTIPRPWSDANGAACNLSAAFMYCTSCIDSESERACRYKCSQAHRGIRSHIAPQGPEATETSYGMRIASGLLPKLVEWGVLGKAESWKFVWGEKVVRRLPRLPDDHGATRNGSRPAVAPCAHCK